MLHNASPIHAVDVGQCDGLLICLVDPHVCEPNVVVETRAKDRGRHIGDDIDELSRIGISTLRIERVVLGEVDGDVLVEGANDVFSNIEIMDEVEEDLALIGFRCRMAGAVRCRASFRRRDRIG